MRRRLLGIGVMLSALLGGCVLWLWHEFATPYYGGAPGETYIEIPRGAGTGAIAQSLKASGALHAKLPFILYVRWTGIGKRLQAGEYRFADAARPTEIVRRLVQGDVCYRTITIPEGLTARETVQLLARGGFGSAGELEALLGRVDWIADLDAQAGSLEGYLFPETYRFPRRAGSEDVLKAMVAECRSRVSRLLAASPLPPGWTLSRIVVLASLIEKEAQNADERRLVSSVLVNRLRKKIPLACDPTIIYALKQAGSYNGNLRKADLAIDSPYNSYLHQGLPPGPIANPGIDSFEAALAPATSDFLFYVSRNDGTHVFSRDLQSHLLAVARYQRRGARPVARPPSP
jgi:UPF0755 protein